MKLREERDALGSRRVDSSCYHGIQTDRALENFAVSGRTVADMPELVKALAMVKKAAALMNEISGQICADKAGAIVQACDEVIAGLWQDAFVVDPYQGGAGTSTNMNANEVIANRALEILGRCKGDYAYLHPVDHVNRSQSTNDSYATAVRISLFMLNERLIEALHQLRTSFDRQAARFTDQPKLGRTQLQDAVPMTVGAELQAYAVTIAEDIVQAHRVGDLFLEINLGGTAIGSGLGASADYSRGIINVLSEVSGLPLRRSHSLYEASWDMGAFVLYSGLVKRIAAKLSKVANDLRLLGSGPRGGIGEYRLPARQPGSSIMPGKVNPVIPELMNMVCFRAFGADTSVTFAAEAGQLQLNAMEPLIVWTLSETVELMINAMRSLRLHCIEGLEVNVDRCLRNLRESTASATALVPHIGYDQAADLARQAILENTPFVDYVRYERPDLVELLDGLDY